MGRWRKWLPINHLRRTRWLPKSRSLDRPFRARRPVHREFAYLQRKPWTFLNIRIPLTAPPRSPFRLALASALAPHSLGVDARARWMGRPPNPHFSRRVGRGRATPWWAVANRVNGDSQGVSDASLDKRPMAHQEQDLLVPPYHRGEKCGLESASDLSFPRSAWNALPGMLRVLEA